jgi:hypothetical protein
MNAPISQASDDLVCTVDGPGPGTGTPARPHGRTRGIVAVVAILACALLVGWAGARMTSAPPEPTIPDHADIEAAWGVRFTSLTVTADGGIVDLRFVVLDPSRATALMADKETAPRVAVESDGEVVMSPTMALHRGLKPGRTYFLLYRNTGGLVRSGHEVSILAADLRIDGAVPG